MHVSTIISAALLPHPAAVNDLQQRCGVCETDMLEHAASGPL